MRLAAIGFATFLAWQTVLATENDALHPFLPDTASSTTEIEQSLRAHSGLVNPLSTELKGKTRRIYVIWNCPYSGLDLNHIFAYAFDGAVWRKFYSGGVRGAPSSVSPHLDAPGETLLIDGRKPEDRVAVPLQDVPTVTKPTLLRPVQK